MHMTSYVGLYYTQVGSLRIYCTRIPTQVVFGDDIEY